MAESYKVAVKVVSQQGHCGAEHKVGDSWTIGTRSPEGMCLSALHAIFPALRALRFGGVFPWEKDPEATTVPCPDAKNPVIFELRRIKK